MTSSSHSCLGQVCLFCVDLLLTIIVVPPIILFLVPFWLYRGGVRILARIFHPDWVAVSDNDTFMTWDIVKPSNGRHVYNVGASVRVQGTVSLRRLQDRIAAHGGMMNLVDKDGKKVNRRAFDEFVLFGGYAFRRPIEVFDIAAQIREVKLENETLASYKARWIEMGYRKGTSPWEVVVIPQEEVGETVLLMKIHHALADAYSLLHVFDSLLDNKVPETPPEPEDSFSQKTMQFFRAARVGMSYNLKTISNGTPLPWKKKNTEVPSYVSSTSLYFPDLKLIQRKTRAYYTSIMLAVFGGVLEKILRSTHSKSQATSTVVQLSFPWPNHPRTVLCNHWTSGGIRVPLGKMKATERLKKVEEDYQSFMESEMNKIMKRFIFPIGAVMPVKLFCAMFEYTRKTAGLRTIFTSAMGFNDSYYELDGNPVISVSPLIGLLGTTPVISGLAFSYKDQVQCTLIASSEVAKDQESMDKIVKHYFAEEVEKFIEELNE